MDVKRYTEENVYVKILDFELTTVSFYGCDARFEIEIRDKETGVLLDETWENLEYAFMGVDDGEDLYYFLEDKGIDFSEQYDDDYSKLPAQLQQEFDEYELSVYDEAYHEYLFDDEDTLKEYSEKILNRCHPVDRYKLYIIKDSQPKWIDVTYDYHYGFLLHSKDVFIRGLYNINVDADGYVYRVEDCYFNLLETESTGLFSWPDFKLILYTRDEDHPYVVTEEDLREGYMSDYWGNPGDVLYNYYERD
jgi:hypothetical protein